MAKYFTISVSLTLAVTACAPENVGSGAGTDTDGGEAELTLGKGSRALAISSEALYFERDGSLVRFDRSTEQEQVLARNVKGGCHNTRGFQRWHSRKSTGICWNAACNASHARGRISSIVFLA